MRKSLFSLFTLMVVSLLMTSCLEVKEKLYMKKNGKGNFSLTIDMSQSKYMLNMMQAMASEEEQQKTEAGLNKAKYLFSKKTSQLERMKGVSNVQQNNDDSNYIYSISFDFDNVEALNKAINATIDNKKNAIEREFFTYDKGELVRSDVIDLKGVIEKELKNEKSPLKNVDPSTIFKDVAYLTDYSFDRKIKNVSNKSSIISEDDKNVRIKYYLFRDNAANQGVGNRINI
ncbi:hypothetical protein [Xanthovirga aplysinae]|uniref:hypothetical protein n=1 Tax=Xanthovirga aplysinae TaxID=2529853 RepID=UPI0012BBEAF8|nr:hypothetical protein [Xanthovirga aplysinae]MTI32978.1 hypothetical protein [Xanthovirga aplysinae]